MKYIFHTICLLLFAVLQSTWLGNPTYLWATPNLFLLYLVIICCYCKTKEGVTLGFISGLILDAIIGNIIGLNAVLMMVMAFFITNFFNSLIRNNTLFITLAIVVVSTLVYEIIYYIVAFLGDLHLKDVIVNVLIPECLVSSIATVPVYLIIKKFAKALWDDKGEGIG